MWRTAYVNGRYVPHHDARVHIEDRGYQFADAVYEVCEVKNGRIIDETRHMDRLTRSLAELGIRAPMKRAALGVVLREVVRRNRVRRGLVYLQISRGVAPRNHAFPAPAPPPSLVVTAHAIGDGHADYLANGVSVITMPDNRWERVDIKTVSLLPNVLAKQKAKERGAFEAWFVDKDGLVTEGASTNAWIVTRDGILLTHPADRGILRGVTRSVVVDLAAREGLSLEERPFSVREALAASEAFLTSSSQEVVPVVAIDDVPIGDGEPGKLATQLRRRFHTGTQIAPIWSAPANPDEGRDGQPNDGRRA